ncbi:MAG: gluconokinase [Candidatus Asgardarchaeia archaeon]
MDELYIGIDLGTGSVRSYVFDKSGNVISYDTKELEIKRPSLYEAEQDPEEIIHKFKEALINSVRKLSEDRKENIRGISISSQLHGMTAVDRDGKPLIPLIIWMDRRSKDIIGLIEKKMDGETIYSKTGCRLNTMYPLAKIFWMKEKKPELFKRVDKFFVSAKDYVIYKIFDEFSTDYSVASGSSILNIKELGWDGEILSLLDLDEEKLPKLRSCYDYLDSLPENIGEQLALREEVPVYFGASDASLSNVGLGALMGKIAVNVGTSGAIRTVSDKPLLDEFGRTFCYLLDENNWLVGGAINSAGLSLKWFKENFGYPTIFTEERKTLYGLISKEAESAKPASVIFLPYLSGERCPIWDPLARGVVFGLDLTTSRGEIARSVMEGVAFALRSIMSVIEENGLKVEEVRIGGGGSRSELWCQIHADVLNKRVVKTEVEEASSLGAAIFASVSSGDFKNVEEAVDNMVRVGREYSPREEFTKIYDLAFQIYLKLYDRLKDLFPDFSKISDRTPY